MLTRRTLAAGLLACPALVSGARAQTWPTRPVKIIVPYPPGGSTDITARLVAEKLSQSLGQRFVIDNRPGAGGNVGMEVAASSPPDGYTLVVATTAHAINMTLFRQLNYDTRTSFEPIALLTENPLVLVVHPSLPAKTVAELIADAKARPGALNYASSGIGQSTHLAAELFCSMAGIRMTHVPYRGSAPGLADVVAGHVQLMFDTTQSALPQIEDGRVRALGITSAERLPIASNIPTVAESGLPGYEAIAWNGFVVPKGTPPDIVSRLNAEVVRAVTDPEIKARFTKLGATTRATTTDEFGRYLAAEIEKWGKVVRVSGAKVE
ncbi:Bug family tripartite tricarboxylate transporter substrate binding protein [uncultured Enterovirga sp.]|uniref:Bug family tripartite tricarboxylate transporter substrate binding protein n=1 Tax=uncultured Enterovirga sp. TaxID=2026352 RepID=UPI0035C9EB25